MTDQVTNDVTPQDAPQVEAPAVNPREEEARASGWVPKDEYTGDTSKWVDADEFLRRGPLFEKINGQSRELKEVKKALEQLKAHHSQVQAAAYKQAVADLKAQKKAALIDGEVDLIVEIDDKIAEAKAKEQEFNQKHAQEVAAATQQEVIHPEFQAWVDRNGWYTTSKPMKAFADTLGLELRDKGYSPSEVLRQVEIQIKEEFPNKFRNANRDKPGAVEGTGKGTGKTSSTDPAVHLTEVERKIMNTFVRQGVMTKEQYIAELKKTKEAQ